MLTAKSPKTTSSYPSFDTGFLENEIYPLFSRALGGDKDRREIYLANHSLGRPPDHMETDIQAGLRVWYEKMDGAWQAEGGWTSATDEFKESVASIVGLTSGDSVVPKTNAGQVLRAVLNSFSTKRPIKIVTTTGEFDSADFILKTYEKAGRAEMKWVGPSVAPGNIEHFDALKVAESITDGTDLLVISYVFYRTGQVLQDLSELVADAHSKGCLVLLDIYHAAGIIPVDLLEIGADFAMGGCYKYLRGGTGGGYLAIHPDVLKRDIKTLDLGWFAKKEPMSFNRNGHYDRAEGAAGWNDSTPNVLFAYQTKAGINLVRKLGTESIRSDSISRQIFLREELRKQGLQPFEPSDPKLYGGFTLLFHENAQSICKRLRASGVNVDARNNLIRFGPDFLNTEAQLQEAAKITRRIVSA